MTTATTAQEGAARRPLAPRIYVACLAAYNKGRLHGRWIDADQAPEDIHAEVQAMLAGSPEPFAEEWAIHDYEGFGEVRLSEWESFDRVSAIAAGMGEHGEAFAAWLSYEPDREIDAQAFEDAYRGEWDSMEDYADNLADDIGLHDAAEKTGSPYVRVDIETMAGDLNIEMWTVERPDGGVYVFDPYC